MRVKHTLWATLVAVLLCGTAFGADRYDIDPAHTFIGFTIRHLVITNVQGRFMDFTGSLVYDESDITKSLVNVTIKAASINTGVEMRDNDLRSPNFFEVAKYPEITFQSSRIEKTGDGYVAVGTMNMHGVSKEVVIPFAINGKVKDFRGKERIGVEGGLTIDRRDWG